MFIEIKTKASEIKKDDMIDMTQFVREQEGKELLRKTGRGSLFVKRIEESKGERTIYNSKGYSHTLKIDQELKVQRRK